MSSMSCTDFSPSPLLVFTSGSGTSNSYTRQSSKMSSRVKLSKPWSMCSYTFSPESQTQINGARTHMSDNIVNVGTLLGPNTKGDKTDSAFFWHTNMGQIRCSMQLLNTMLLLPPQSLSTLKTKSIMSKKHSNSKHTWNEEIDRSNTQEKTPVNYYIKVAVI